MGEAQPPFTEKATTNTFPFHPRSIDTPKQLRICIIGAGISGIGLYIRLSQYVPSANITIYEKNESVGGTWFENRYPGVACDIPSHVYQYTFSPNPSWSKFFSGGPEILSYVKSVSAKYGVERAVEFETEVRGMVWIAEKGVWEVGVRKENPAGEKRDIETHEFEVVINATGCLNHWEWPDIEGLMGFEGKKMHSADWDVDWNYENLNVALIGVGSSAIQILPHLQKKCKTVLHLARGKTWISEPFGGAATQDTIAGDKDSGNYSYTAEEIEKFKTDPEHYHKYRKHIERFINLDHPCLFPGTEAQISGTEGIISNMRTKLASKPEIYEMLEPSFRPGCRRLTPGPGFLEALVEDNVTFTNASISHVTKDSIVLKDGSERKVDAIICATGFNTSFLPRFPITTSTQSLERVWAAPNTASAYLSLSHPGFPNYFIVGGPNSATGGGSLLIIFESVIGYITKCVQKMAREHVKTMRVGKEGLRSWERYMEKYFPGTVHVEGCTSWYKAGRKEGRVVGLWPGSSLHARTTLEFPRWEDWEFEYEEGDDRLGWLGDGWTTRDRERGDCSFYLDEIDYPPVPTL